MYIDYTVSKALLYTQLRKDGLSDIDIAVKYGVKEDTVRRTIERTENFASIPDSRRWGGRITAYTPNKNVKFGTYEKVLFVPDIHAPHHDVGCIRSLLKFTAYYQPDRLVFMGDGPDFAGISRYERNVEEVPSVQDCIDAFKRILDSLVASCASSTIIDYVMGNHDRRFQTYLFNKASGLGSLRVLQDYSELIGIAQHGGRCHSKGFLLRPDFTVMHGEQARKGGGATALAMLKDSRGSGAVAHCHRLGQAFSHINKFAQWVETGCVCSLHPDYSFGFTDWQQGWAIGEFRKGKGKSQDNHNIQLISYRSKKAVYNGMEF